MNKTWKDSPFIRDNRDALSAEVCDLLDRIFVVDPTKRITVPEIMSHPWCGSPSQSSIVCKRLLQGSAHPLFWTPSCCDYLLVHQTHWWLCFNQRNLSQL